MKGGELRIIDLIIFIATLTAIFFVPFSTFAAEVIIYESDFSSNPNWTTDQPENFYWDEAKETLFAHLSLVPINPDSFSTERYFYIPTELNPKESFKLNWDIKLLSGAKYQTAVFGLYDNELRMRDQRKKVFPHYVKSSINIYYREKDPNGYYQRELSFNQYEPGGSDIIGSRGSDTELKENLWYTSEIEHLAMGTDSKLTFRFYEKDSGKMIRENTYDFPFSPTEATMQNLGIAGFPIGNIGTNEYEYTDLEGSYSEYLIDNVSLVQITNDPEPVHEPPLSDLLLQYEPVLYFHENEDYFPMNVEAYVEDSGLWDSNGTDQPLIPRGEGNELNLEYLATTTDTSNWYVAFSSDEAGTFDLAAAKDRYDSLVESGEAMPTYYAYETEDSYVDDFGNEREFIVLQYWYFYAMNNWREQGGFNDHEGDFESVFVFLDKATEEPLYVAFSAHHNDGDPSFNPIQYDSVRREWMEVEKNEDKPISYVALGSHANYHKSGEHFARIGTDITSQEGVYFDSDKWLNREELKTENSIWSNKYEGLFGTNKLGVGSTGTQGPVFTKVSGIRRLEEPIKWAGIDKIAETTLLETIQSFDLGSQGVSFSFAEALEAGTEFGSSLHEEIISFGSNISEIDLLPKFWDFNISKPAETFSVDVSLYYEDELINELGLTENLLKAYYYNETSDEWIVLPSTIDTVNNQVSFNTTHFSIYTIGEGVETLQEEQIEETEEDTQNTEEPVEEVEENSSSSNNSGSTSTRVGDRENDPKPEVAGASTINLNQSLQIVFEKIIYLRNEWENGLITTNEFLLKLHAILVELFLILEN